MDIESIKHIVIQYPLVAPILFIVCNALGMVLFLPSSWFLLASGFLFGPILGPLYSLIGTFSGCVLSFVVSRYFVSDWSRKKGGKRVNLILDRVSKEGWRFVAFARITPFFPYNIVNYGLGISRITLSQYAIISFIFMIPKCVVYSYLGYLSMAAVTGSEELILNLFVAISLVIAIFLLSLMIKSKNNH